MESRCPGCGAPLQFATPGSYVAICDTCHSAVARADFANLGKVGDLASSDSPLALGMRGAYRGDAFELVGRTQLRSSEGAVWQEWYAHFPQKDTWGWLSEAQGQFYLLFEQAAPWQGEVQPDAVVQFAGHAFTVHEVGEAHTTAAAGELPFVLNPTDVSHYADATGAYEAFATFDLDDRTHAYVGRVVTLADLGVEKLAAAPKDDAPVAARKLACPQCGGSLNIAMPDKAEHLGCPYCGSVLDVRSEAARIIEANAEEPTHFALPLGRVGKLDGAAFRILGVLRRQTTSDGVDYVWDEYLLYERSRGYVWLVHAQGHWSWVTPVAPQAVHGGTKAATYQGKAFRIYGTCEAKVVRVVGEFYWQVRLGDSAKMDDFVAPPRMLSREKTRSETTWSLGTYTDRKVIHKAFGVQLPKPDGIGPHQPWRHAGSGKAALFLSLTAYLLHGFLACGMPEKVVHSQHLVMSDAANTVFSEPFDLEDGHNLAITVQSDDKVGWAHLDGDFVEEATGTVLSWSQDLESDDDDDPAPLGEKTEYLSAPPKGSYTLRIESQGNAGTPVNLTVKQGVPNPGGPLHFAIFNAVVFVVFMLNRLSFESKRWANSDYGDNA